MSDFYAPRKKRKLEHTSGINTSPKNDFLNATEAAFTCVRNLFPVKELCGRLPPVILAHQVYSILENRTTVDKETNSLVEKDVIRLFKLGLKETTIVAIFTEDFKRHVLGRVCPCQVETNTSEYQEETQSSHGSCTTNSVVSTLKPSLTIEQCRSQACLIEKKDKDYKVCHQSQVVVRFINEVMPKIQDVSVDKELLQQEHRFGEEDLRTLMNFGLLVVRCVGSYWLSFPNAGEFMKHFTKGRAAITRLIKKCKFSEILQPELEKRQLDKTAKYGIKYHIHDLIGGDFVECLKSTSGTILRISSPKK